MPVSRVLERKETKLMQITILIRHKYWFLLIMSVVTILYSIHIAANVKVLNQDKFQNMFSVWNTLLIFFSCFKSAWIETNIDEKLCFVSRAN